MTSPYLTDTPVLSLAERRARIERNLYAVTQELAWTVPGTGEGVRLLATRSLLLDQLANLSED